ncbi:MAG: hypothetical protein IT480_08725 [Gammaproteobacteria bacterium]|nr:hypothetical protein [Gammaproteobacteria bacterium]
MTPIVRTTSGILCALLATGLGALAIAADAGKPPAPRAGAAASPADMAQRHQQRVQRRLDAAAARLEIKASQQSAWQGYSAAVKDLADAESLPPRAAADADAATIARQRAERASTHARKLAALAEATGTLQAALTAGQQQVLTELTRNAGMHGGPMMLRRQARADWHGTGHDAASPGIRKEAPAAQAPASHAP